MAEIVVMPKLNLTMEEGVIVEWNKKAGEVVKTGEVLCSIETEKSVVEMESPAAGTLLKIWGVVGERYAITTPIALVGGAEEDVTELLAQAELKLAGGVPKAEGEKSSPAAIPSPALHPRMQVKMLPKVRKLVQDLGIDVAALVEFCSGRKITEEELLAFQKNLQPARKGMEVDSRDRRVRMSTIRRTIAANMSESTQKTARLTNVTEVDMTRVMEELHARKDQKISLTALVVKACALAIREHEIINTVLDGDTIIYKADVNIGVAVDIPEGLVVPVIRNADVRDILALSGEISDFAARAARGALSQADMTGGTFTITNVGMLAVDLFTPVINYPQTAIMGIGAIKRLPRFLNDDQEKVVPRYVMNLCLSYDHRVIDGAPAARFSLKVRDLLQDVSNLFKSGIKN
jgi:pyruvate dehydrogenase E2 component (dihydrolipoamide acetyltransferase)